MNLDPSRMQQNGKLFAALAKAQAEARFVKKDKPSNFGDRPYAASEAIIDECKEPLNKYGLALIPISFEAKPCDAMAPIGKDEVDKAWLRRPIMISRYFKLGHESGEYEILGPYDWPTNPNNMNTNFTAFGGTDTFSLAYVYRDLLGMPRLTPQEIKSIELEEQKMKQALAIARAENGESTPPEKKPEKQKPTAEEKSKTAETTKQTEKTAETKKEEKPKAVETAKVAEAKPPEKPAEAKPASAKHEMNPAKPPEAKKEPVDPNAGAQPAAAAPAPSVTSPASSTAPASPGEAKSDPQSQGAVSAPSTATVAASGTPQTSSPQSSNGSTPAATDSGAPSATPTSTSSTTSGTTPVPGGDDSVLRNQQMAILQRLQRHAAKRLKELAGDATALEAELNKAAGAPADKPVMLEGKFRRGGLTDAAIRNLDSALRMVGV